jgi:hypothetical protein
MSATSPPGPDGERWRADYVSSHGATADVRNERAVRLVVLGYITAVALPLIGLILGIWWPPVPRNESRSTAPGSLP